MSDFDPVTLYFILYESMGFWLWLLLSFALILLVGIVASVLKLRRAGRALRGPLLAALIVGLIVAVAATFTAPAWTLADISALTVPLDYIFAFLLGLIPGAIAAALAFILAAQVGAARGSEQGRTVMP
ncbi:MAG TPA: DUF5368 family protein [Kiloniellales bacterium]|nr:DUF5368 family protein [Kiloniellales bacterium]